jgi:hypothetical protein
LTGLTLLEGFELTTKTKQSTTVNDEEVGDYVLDETKYFVQVVAKKIELLEAKNQGKSSSGNKGKILEAIQRLESSGSPFLDSQVIKAISILKSLDFESID